MSQINPDFTEPGWEELEATSVYRNPWVECLRVRTLTPSRREKPVEWTVVRRKRGAAIAPITPSGGILLVRQERVPLRQTLWEFPAGQIDIAGPLTDEDIRDTALRELREETGYELGSGGVLLPLGYYFSSQGFTDEQVYLFAAVGVVPHAGGQQTDANEVIYEAREFSPAEFTGMMERCEVRDANTLSLAAKLMLRGLLRLNG